jgi:hypothetical protein
LAEYALGNSIGIDPLYTLIPGTFLIFAADQLLYRGAGFETIYQTLFPEYKKKIITHEAGHFLIAYLLGVPVRACVTNAIDAQKYPDIRGQAGTIFFDPKLADEMNASKVTRSSLDRISVVIMAGIAAEALKFGRAEGGAVDEQSLIGFLTSISPPWNILRVQGQARWAAMQSILLLREHQSAFDALIQALEQGKGVGDCVLAIEENLPQTLPSKKRIEEKKRRKKAQESEMLMKYIQKVTWKVGGILNAEYDGNTIKGPNPHEQAAPVGVDVESAGKAVVGLDGYIVGAKKDGEFVADSPTAIAERKDAAVQLFAQRIKKLEKAVSTGVIDVVEKAEGGIWLNNLATLNTNTTATPVAPNIVSKNTAFPSDITIPPPIDGYEERLEALARAEKEKEAEKAAEATAALVEAEVDPLTPRALLKSHRGYQLKKLENIVAGYEHKVSTYWVPSIHRIFRVIPCNDECSLI